MQKSIDEVFSPKVNVASNNKINIDLSRKGGEEKRKGLFGSKKRKPVEKLQATRDRDGDGKLERKQKDGEYQETLLYDIVHDYIIAENFASDTEGANKVMLKLSDELMQEIYERMMTASEKRKDTMLKKKYDDSDMKKNMQAQYGKEEGKKVYFATIRKQAMKKEEVESVEEKIKYDKSGSSMDYFLGADPKKTEYYKKNAKKKMKKEEVEQIDELKLSAKDKEGLNKSVKAAVANASAKTGLNRPEAMRFEPKEEVEHLDELNKQERMETSVRGGGGVGKRFAKKTLGANRAGKGKLFGGYDHRGTGNVGRRNMDRFENKPVKRQEGSLDKKRRQTFKTVTVDNPKTGYSKKSDAVGAGKKLTTRKLSKFGSDYKSAYGPQKHHTQGNTSSDAAAAQRGAEHKARRGVKTKGPVASDIKKSLKETNANEAYEVTNADKKANTKAYQDMKAGKKNQITGEPLYKKADHMKENLVTISNINVKPSFYKSEKDLINDILNK